MALTSMKTSGSDACMPCDNSYGYGLMITLNGEQCEALGIMGPIKPGTKVTLQATATVMSATEELEGDDSDDQDGKTDVRLQMQITDLALNQSGAPSKAAATLYGE